MNKKPKKESPEKKKPDVKEESKIIPKGKVETKKRIKPQRKITKKWIKPVDIILSIVCLAVVLYLLACHLILPGLSKNDVKAMLKEKNYFDYYNNPDGKGIKNKYVLQEINGDSIVFDEATNLTWQQSGSLEYIRFESAKEYIDELNEKKFADFNDWRLPTLEEAVSLMEPEKKNDLHIDSVFDSKQRWIWTADQVKGASGHWVVGFTFGRCYRNPFLLYGRLHYVRAVRSGQSSKK